MRANIWQILSVSVLFFFGTAIGQAQSRNRTYEAYVKQYADEAIRQMSRYNIPASITIAQALVETGAGASTLASVHNNHFGIKCHKSWTGKRTYRTTMRRTNASAAIRPLVNRMKIIPDFCSNHAIVPCSNSTEKTIGAGLRGCNAVAMPPIGAMPIC